MESGVASRPISDLQAYRDHLKVGFKSALFMRPVFEAARGGQRQIVFAEGEDERVLRAAHSMREQTIDTPILIGRPDIILQRARDYAIPINRRTTRSLTGRLRSVRRILRCVLRSNEAPWRHTRSRPCSHAN